MAGLSGQDPKIFAFGLLGNIVSFVVFLAPLPTFYQIYKKKTSDGYQSVPYVFALFSAMLLIYYALIKENESFVIIINSIGCFTEAFYILAYFYYASRISRIQTAKFVFLLNVCGFGLIFLLTRFVVKERKRHEVVGWICLSFSVSVFAAPLAIIRRVIRTKSVEYMPFPLSFFLTLSAVMWFFYGFFQKDLYIATPNVLGLIFGLAQMILYAIYRRNRKVLENPKKNIDVMQISTMVCAELSPVVIPAEFDGTKIEGVKDKAFKEEIEQIQATQNLDASENV